MHSKVALSVVILCVLETVAVSQTQIGSDWKLTAEDKQGQPLGSLFHYICAPAAKTSRHPTIFGTGLYTDDSAICQAAAHSGVITRALGGNVTIKLAPAQPYYANTTQNNITSRHYGVWGASYIIVGGVNLPVIVTVPFVIDWDFEFEGFPHPQAFNCPAVAQIPRDRHGRTPTVWGTKIYTSDSSICVAAVHTGVLKFTGGVVHVAPRPGQEWYNGSTQNNVTSKSYGAYRNSFEFLPAPTPAPTPTPTVITSAPTPMPSATTSAPTPMPTGSSVPTPTVTYATTPTPAHLTPSPKMCM